jgi:hypothetical protein
MIRGTKMNIIRRRMTAGIAVLACILFLQSCAYGKRLNTDASRIDNIQGTYTLILYGGNYADDLETAALLDKEGDRYTFEPYASEFIYKVIKGQTAEHALPAAEQFVRGHSAYHQQQMRAVLDDHGAVIGYEIRPLYLPLTYGQADVLDIDYYAKDDKVIVVIKRKPFLEQRGNGFRHDHWD